MKVVINKCYGGFGLSPKAIARLAELRGQKAYFFKLHHTEEYQPLDPDKIKGIFWTAFNTPTPTARIGAVPWSAMSQSQRDEYTEKYEAEEIYDCRYSRNDPLLVQVVEELGGAASNDYSALKVVEIPDDVDFVIDEYDGMETIREKHRSW